MSRKKKYEKEYKIEAVKLSRKIGKGQAAKELGILLCSDIDSGSDNSPHIAYCYRLQIQKAVQGGIIRSFYPLQPFLFVV